MPIESLKRSSVLPLEIAGVQLTFVFVSNIGKAPVDGLNSDLDLITKVHAMDLHEVLRFGDQDVFRQVADTVSEFPGRRGTSKLLQVPLKNSRGEKARRLMFVGLGPCQQFDGNIVCETFETLFAQALEIGAESVTVPFIPNPMTKDRLSHKATAYKLKDVLKRLLEKQEVPVNLREVKIWCTPPAVRHIKAALLHERPEGCHCQCQGQK